MALKKGKVVDKFRFYVNGRVILSVMGKPVTCLGKLFDCSLRHAASFEATIKNLDTWMFTVDRSDLPSRFIARLYQRSTLPHILWPLLVYEVNMSIEE